jgi:hypothetical protein
VHLLARGSGISEFEIILGPDPSTEEAKPSWQATAA